MTYSLNITQEAKEKIIQVFLWYEQKREGLGSRFVFEVDAMFNYIKAYPYHFQVKYKNFREAVLKVFPYVIVYGIIQNEVVIYIVFPTKDNPTKKP